MKRRTLYVRCMKKIILFSTLISLVSFIAFGSISLTAASDATVRSYPYVISEAATLPQEEPQPEPRIPLQPAVVHAQEKDTRKLPANLHIPAIGLNSPIEYMGVIANGEMDVPSGTTNNVGWYKEGTVPGEQGSAVLAAHVFAAFSKLHQMKAGDSMYVQTKNGEQLRFVVREMKWYPLSELNPDMLFNRNNGKRLTLITCAGNLTPDRSTYDHRLVVYAVLAE